MIAAVAFMTIAAIRAQTAYLHRFDDHDGAEHNTNSAIRMALAGMACVIAEKMLS